MACRCVLWMAVMLIPCAFSMQSGLLSRKSNRKPSNSSCLAQGSTYFNHVMKDGGTSINHYLECLCRTTQKCRVYHAESGRSSGNEACDISICSSHGQFQRRTSKCAGFYYAEQFTFMRYPTERVVSYYNYERCKNETSYFQKPLREIIDDIGDCYEKNNDFKCQELNNSMVGYTFSNAEIISMFEPTTTSFHELQGMQKALPIMLEHAKGVLASFDAIFFTSEIKRFPEQLGQSKLSIASLANESICRTTHSNKGACTDYVPTVDEIALIEQMNRGDIALYKYAKTLPNAIENSKTLPAESG